MSRQCNINATLHSMGKMFRLPFLIPILIDYCYCSNVVETLESLLGGLCHPASCTQGTCYCADRFEGWYDGSMAD